MIGQLDGQYASFVERYLDPVSVSGNEAMCVCIFHDDHNASMQFNLDKGLFTCFSCNVGGSYKKIERKLGISHTDIGVGLDVIHRKLNDLKRNAGLDEGPRLLPESTLQRYTMPTDYWETRGLWKSTIKAFDLGYDIMADAATIPLRTVSGDLLGVTRRFLDPDADSKYRYPKGFKRSDHLFGSWLVANDPSASSVALTEGQIDAMTLWQWGVPAMAVYGSSISVEQIRLMRHLGLSQITLFFDNDNAGFELSRRCRGWKQVDGGVWKKLPDLDLRRYFDVKMVKWSGITKRQAKDVNDLNMVKARNMLANAPRL